MILENVILSPVVTEKAVTKNEGGQYVFWINKDATKVDVKMALEHVFGRKVSLVRVSTLPEKTRRTKTGIAPKRKARKKAYVTFADSTPFELTVLKK